MAAWYTGAMRSDRKPLLAFLASGLLFVLFLLAAFGPLGADKPPLRETKGDAACSVEKPESL